MSAARPATVAAPMSAAPEKTDAARAALARRDALPPSLRMLLIVVDGQRKSADLLAIARSLGLAGDALHQLHARGLITWRDPQAVASPARAQDRTAQVGASAAPDGAFQLMRAKMFALDLAARMLAGRDKALRASARLVECETTFDAWLEDCSHVIADIGGADRAELFLKRVMAIRLTDSR